MTNIWQYIIIVVCIILSACFSGSEIALNSVNKLRLSKQAEENGDKRSALVLKLYENYDRTLSAILIGNNLVNILSSTVSTMIFLSVFSKFGSPNADDLAAILSTVVMTVIILIFGEIVPKILAKEHSEPISKWLAYPLKALSVILFPVIFVVLAIINGLSRIWNSDKKDDTPTVTEDELVSIIETAEEEQVIDEEASEMLQSAIEFGDSSLNEILIPRTDMLAIDIADPMDEIKKIIHDSHHSRIPVYEDSTDNIIGILSLNRYFRERAKHEITDIRPLLMKPTFYHKAMKLPYALNDMRKNHTHIAIVTDEFGGTLGLVTMEDILEEIVGEIWDESDDIKNDITQTGDKTYDVSGDMNIYDFFDAFELDDEDIDSEYTTVGGWCIEKLGGVVAESNHFEYENLYIIISHMDDMRILTITVVENEKPDEEDENSDED